MRTPGATPDGYPLTVLVERNTHSVLSDDIPQPTRWSPWLAFWAIAVFALALRLACMTGLMGSDDLQYAIHAEALLEGRYEENLAELRPTQRIHHGLRYSVIVPLAAIYRVFGMSEGTTIALPLLASTGSVILVAAIALRMFDRRVALIASLLYATFPMHLRLATILVPEPIGEFLILLAVLSYLYARDGNRAPWVAAGLFTGAAYLAKEPAVFIGVALALHAIAERRWRGAMLLAAGLAGVIAVEHLYYLFGHGDLLFRHHSTQLWKVDAASLAVANRDLPYWLFKHYPRMMLVPNLSFGLHSLACLLWAAAAIALKPRRGYALLFMCAVIPWLYQNFGSWSLQYYVLLPREARYIVITYAPLMVLSGVLLSRAFSARPVISKPVAAIFGIVLVVGVITGLASRGQHSKAEEMTVLREIARAAGAVPGERIYTDEARWRNALKIFNPSLISASPDAATLIVLPGPLQLPVVKRASSAAPPEPLPFPPPSSDLR